jgi:hypothetical protein
LSMKSGASSSGNTSTTDAKSGGNAANGAGGWSYNSSRQAPSACLS